MAEIIATTSPGTDMLWRVTYSHRDSEGDPVRTAFHVIARTRDEALVKAQKPSTYLREAGFATLEGVSIVTLEDLIPARKPEPLGAGFSTQELVAVHLADDDSDRYRLGVCLIPLY